MTITRRELIATASAGAAAMTQAAQAQAPGNTLRVALGSMVAMLDPNARTSGPPATIVFYPIFDTLTFTDEKGELTPALAASWSATSPTTWEFALREGARFSNGEPCDAAAVKFTYDRVLDPAKQQVVRARIATIKSVEVVSATRVRITTNDPDPILPRRVGSIFILPPKYHAEVGDEGFAAKPIGSGAFKLAAFTPSQSVRLEAVDTSWRGKPGVAAIEIRSIPEASTRASALRAGEVHLAESIPPDIAPLITRERGLSVVSQTLGQVNLIILDTREPALEKREVRQALNYAVDKNAIVRGLMRGYAEPTGQLVAPNGFGHDPEIKPYGYDPERAKKMLADAGVRDLSLTLHSTQGLQLNDKEVTEAVAGYLNAVGVKASVSVLETAAFVQNYHRGAMAPAFFIGWWYFPAMDGDFVYVWNRSSAPQSRFKRPEFDALYDGALREMDSGKRLATMRRMARLFHDEAAAIFLFHPAQTYGVRGEVKGFVPRPDRVIWFDSIALG